jgi:hypothetical protein
MMDEDSIDIDAFEKKLRKQTWTKRKKSGDCLIYAVIFILLSILIMYTLLALAGTVTMPGNWIG